MVAPLEAALSDHFDLAADGGMVRRRGAVLYSVVHCRAARWRRDRRRVGREEGQWQAGRSVGPTARHTAHAVGGCEVYVPVLRPETGSSSARRNSSLLCGWQWATRHTATTAELVAPPPPPPPPPLPSHSASHRNVTYFLLPNPHPQTLLPSLPPTSSLLPVTPPTPPPSLFSAFLVPLSWALLRAASFLRLVPSHRRCVACAARRRRSSSPTSSPLSSSSSRLPSRRWLRTPAPVACTSSRGHVAGEKEGGRPGPWEVRFCSVCELALCSRSSSPPHPRVFAPHQLTLWASNLQLQGESSRLWQSAVVALSCGEVAKTGHCVSASAAVRGGHLLAVCVKCYAVFRAGRVVGKEERGGGASHSSISLPILTHVGFDSTPATMAAGAAGITLRSLRSRRHKKKKKTKKERAWLVCSRCL